MTPQTYQQLILDGIDGLPPDLLAEITDFVYFVRKRTLEQQNFEAELRQLSRAQVSHLEKEFDTYEQRYPRE
jgi:hypothetical protein